MIFYNDTRRNYYTFEIYSRHIQRIFLTVIFILRPSNTITSLEQKLFIPFGSQGLHYHRVYIISILRLTYNTFLYISTTHSNLLLLTRFLFFFSPFHFVFTRSSPSWVITRRNGLLRRRFMLISPDM